MLPIFLLSCVRVSTVEPLPSGAFQHLEELAQQRVPDPLRGGPPFSPDSSPLPPFSNVNRGTAHYVGADTCASCHPQAAAVWQKSHHAKAMQTLEKARASYNPACVRCHSTGFQHPGGYQRGPALAAVGCESCHGPGSDHLLAPTQEYGSLPADGSACVACHTHDQAPDFQWEVGWPKIQHGREKQQ